MPVSVFIAMAVVVAILVAARWGWSWFSYRGSRVVTCPENHRPAGVALNAARAASTAFVGSPNLRLSTCSRWPEKAGCGQECLREIQEAPGDCLVRNIAARWYAGKVCAGCGKPIHVEWGASQPALISADHESLEWHQVPADKLFETLESSAPVCFACHMANKLVREHPDLAIERHRSGSM